MRNSIFRSFLIPFLWFVIAKLALSAKEEESVKKTDLIDVELLPQMSRRGFAGDDFYQKASKSIPRMGRRSESNNCFCKPFSENEEEPLESEEDTEGLIKPEVHVEMKKRASLSPTSFSVWPWYSDRIPNPPTKRSENECMFVLKYGDVDFNGEICAETFCCITEDEPVFKRYYSTRSSKPSTTSAPDYKMNKFR